MSGRVRAVGLKIGQELADAAQDSSLPAALLSALFMGILLHAADPNATARLMDAFVEDRPERLIAWRHLADQAGAEIQDALR